MHFSSILQSLMAMSAIIPSAIATPIAASPPSTLSGFSLGDPVTVNGPLSKRSYAHSCNSCKIGKSAKDLTCQCVNNAGKRVSSYLNLDRCLVNNNGVPAWRLNGGFSASCTWETYGTSEDRNTVDFKTFCKRNNGEGWPAYTNLNERIHNNNGVLECHV